jgi:hypothetical protein
MSVRKTCGEVAHGRQNNLHRIFVPRNCEESRVHTSALLALNAPIELAFLWHLLSLMSHTSLPSIQAIFLFDDEGKRVAIKYYDSKS